MLRKYIEASEGTVPAQVYIRALRIAIDDLEVNWGYGIKDILLASQGLGDDEQLCRRLKEAMLTAVRMLMRDYTTEKER